MRRILKRVAILLIIVMVAMIGLSVVAAGTESVAMYNGRTGRFEFENALPFGDGEAPDLFTDLKDLMPGDRVSQEISIGAKHMDNWVVRIHLRAENPNEDYQKLVYDYGHWVKLSVMHGETEITGDLQKGVVLGTFDGENSTEVTVNLEIDPEAGNELQGLIAEIDWVFSVETMPGTMVLPTPNVGENDLPWLTTEHINYIVGYEDQTVRPNATITRAEVATIFYRLLTDEARDAMWSTESIYPDVTEDDWFYVAICTLTKGGILRGYPDGNFRPNAPITRAELATMICRFDTKFGELEITENFPDVEGHWAEDEIEFAATRSYVIGYPDGTFRPNRNITRAETVTMVNRCLKRAVDETGLLENHLNWPDNPPNTWYYYEIIEAANYHAYTRSERPIEKQPYCYEDWTWLYEPIDWGRAEQEWIKIHTGR